ncbi:RNB-domain-containing protein [Pluteus cervinus]|uniref:RNB-domain-containing protein n=1 Tax=Pluteus cervinus TaxID=181527 RepID=A0ACD3BBF9_9AGAR|nr:RNB-domain-containing protein [Pluteus cervinus]
MAEESREFEELSDSIPQGAFVETSRNELTSHGLVIGEVYSDRSWRILMLTSAGELWMPQRDDVMYMVPNAISSDLAARCGTGEYPEGPKELNARVEALKQIRSLEKTLEDAYALVCSRAGGIYPKVKSTNPDAWATTDIETVCRHVFGKVDPIKVFATHKYLMRHPTQFLAHHVTRQTGKFQVRPENDVAEVELVQKWTRFEGGPLDGFVDKARKVMEKNQQLQQSTFDQAPGELPAEHTWTPEERTILSFLLHSLRPWRSSQPDPYTLAASNILKRIYPKLPHVTDPVMHQLLVDLGVFAPWQDLTVLRPEVVLTSSNSNNETWLAHEAVTPPPTPLGLEDLHTVDPLEAIRHDFGDMPVYVIDDATAHELDDGISIEKILEEPDNVWIHVHIADPASVIPVTHSLAQKASGQWQSSYFLHHTSPLFPEGLIHSPTHGSSLGARSSNGEPDRVLTFSGKINSNGDLIDHQVRAGLVRNIQRLSYDQVDLAIQGSLIKRHYPFGGRAPTTMVEPIQEPTLVELRDLLGVSRRLVDKRIRDGVYMNSEYKASIDNFKPAPEHLSNPTLEARHFTGFPSFSYSVSNTHESDTGSRNLVAEMMKIACRVASRFCLERDVPALRRTSARAVTNSESDFQRILDMRTPNGYAPFYLILPMLSFNPGAGYSLQPKEHFPLNVPEGEGYVRVTSPLRRYSDLVAHWQIHHALLGSSAPTTSPPFDPKRLQDMAFTLTTEERLQKRITGQHERFWHIMYIQRWLEGVKRGSIQAEVNPMEEFEGHTLLVPKLNDAKSWQTEAYIPKLGLRALVTGLPGGDVPLATALPLKFSALRLGTLPQLQAEVRK